MKPVYDAANLIDAHLVRHALEDAGIPVFIRGEALTGGMGELPLHGLLQVCVPKAGWEAADAVVRGLGFGDACAAAENDGANSVGSGCFSA